ncbi:MAG: hypothetical protein ACYTG5_09285 [Planctomycetota bacterium]
MKALYASAATFFLAAALVAQSGQGTAQSEYDALIKEHEAAVAEWRAEMKVITDGEEYKAAREARDREAMQALTSKVNRPDTAAFVARFAKAGKRYAGQEEAVQFHLWIVMNGGTAQKESVVKSVDVILADHIESEALQPPQFRGMMLSRSLGQERYQEVVDLIVAKNPHDMVKANLLFERAQGMSRGRDVSEADKAKAQELFDRVAELAAGTTLALKAQGPRFKAENLQVGMVAPDIIAEDLDGVTFKLSDYRGKVVMLDFWGDW